MSICEKDLLLTKRPGEHYTGEVYYVKHNASQRMYYFRGQQSEEITLFSTFDSESRGVTAGTSSLASLYCCHRLSLRRWRAARIVCRSARTTAVSASGKR